MQSFPINFLALVAATVAKGVLGWLWYSPPLFLTPWMRLTGVSDAQMKAGMGKALAVEVVGNFVMAFVLVHAVHYAGAHGALQGAAVGFFNWLGFVLVVALAGAAYEKRPLALVAINTGYQLVGLLVMGAIVAVWV
jgi:uncharacterized protein DUF1761